LYLLDPIDDVSPISLIAKMVTEYSKIHLLDNYSHINGNYAKFRYTGKVLHYYYYYLFEVGRYLLILHCLFYHMDPRSKRHYKCV